MTSETKEISSTNYFTLWSDGRVGVSDGVGFVDMIEETEMKEFVRTAYHFYFNS